MKLENEHNVYILGAGFSRDRGLPLMQDFTQRVRDAHPWLRARGRMREADAVEAVLKYRLESTASAYHVDIDLENIEQLFSLASLGDSTLDDSIRLAIGATLDFVESSTPDPKATFDLRPNSPAPGRGWVNQGVAPGRSAWQRWEADAYQFYLACMLGRLVHSPDSAARNTILTFNYDLVVERALTALAVAYSYGFKKQGVNYHAGATCERYGAVAALPLLKLHGSLNWARRGGRGRGLTVFGTYSDVVTIAETPALVPPTWDKHFDNQLRAVWSAAREALTTATRVVVLGFSMPETDLHFKYLLAAGLASNISLRSFHFVNPGAGVPARVDQLFRLTGKVLPQLELVPLDTKSYFARFATEGAKIGRAEEPGEPGAVSV